MYDGGGDLDAGVLSRFDGFFVSSVTAGDTVPAGAEIGRLHGYDGALLETVTHRPLGMVMFLRRQARTRAGDVLFSQAATTAATSRGGPARDGRGAGPMSGLALRRRPAAGGPLRHPRRG